MLQINKALLNLIIINFGPKVQYPPDWMNKSHVDKVFVCQKQDAVRDKGLLSWRIKVSIEY